MVGSEKMTRHFDTEFLPWTKALHAAGVPVSIKNAHGYWGYEKGHGGHVVCSVWDDKIMGGYPYGR